jgi:Family of unknown function (DUF6481)
VNEDVPAFRRVCLYPRIGCADIRFLRFDSSVCGPCSFETGSAVRFWLWRSPTGNSADRSRHLSTDLVTSSLKRTDDLGSNPPRQACEFLNLGLVHVLEYGAASADLKPSSPWARSRFKIEMNRSKNTSFADRLSAAADAKKAQLERAARAKSEAESPAAVERRTAREAVRVARDARIAERRATKLAAEARQAAALAAAQAAEAAAREAALKAEQEARDAEFAEQTAREAALEAERQAARDARYAARKARKRKGR